VPGLPVVIPVIKNSFNNVASEKSLFVFFFILIILKIFLLMIAVLPGL